MQRLTEGFQSTRETVEFHNGQTPWSYEQLLRSENRRGKKRADKKFELGGAYSWKTSLASMCNDLIIATL